tara:strand:+ start:5059 stop:5637 length:579 start_codon:yes stop_codon:yes gene_type:complete
MINIDILIENQLSKLLFLSVSFIVIATGYVTQVVGCQTHKYFENNIYVKHVIGLFSIFLLIMLEGGWSFNQEIQDKADVDWSNGNVIDTFAYSVGIYLLFALSAKMRLIPNIIFYTLLFTTYLINTQRLFWKNRKMIKDKSNKNFINIIKTLLILTGFSFVYGIGDYILYQKNSRKLTFSMFKLLLGKTICL